jgi:hypothetical protein
MRITSFAALAFHETRSSKHISLATRMKNWPPTTCLKTRMTLRTNNFSVSLS